MTMKRKVLTITLAGTLALGSTMPVLANKMPGTEDQTIIVEDLGQGKWYTDSMVDLVEKGVLKGYNGKVNPNANITRAEYIQILHNIMEEEWTAAIHPDLLPGSMDDIKDVKESDWFFKQLRIGMMNGIIKDGYEGRLRPNDPLTREEMFVMTVRAFHLENYQDPNGPEDRAKNFKDQKDISSWSRDSINYLLEKDIIKGDHENKLLPKKNITRAEAAVIISAMDQVKELKPELTVIRK